MVFLKERIGKLLSDLETLIYTDVTPVTEFRYRKTEERFEDPAAVCTDDWAEFGGGQLCWGGHREYYWFETFVTIPPEMDGKCVVYEQRTGKEGEWDATNPQFTIYVNDVRVQGLDVNHREVILSEHARAGERYRILLSAFTGDHNTRLTLDACIKVLHRDTEKYYYDLKVPYEVALMQKESDASFRDIILTLNESLNLLDLRREHSPEYERSLGEAQAFLDREFYGKYTGKVREKVYCVGHTHIDVAWLWTLAVTRDKAVRSFSTVLELMKQYPEYIFMSSQPQLYKYVKENAPDVYAQIRERVKEGRWETEGGMFLEADCNLTSGESLVRQFLYGKRFFKEEFGKDNEILWLPDVFGYSAALPQIMKKCGIRYFMTTKISWNEFNKMPCDTFLWEGIDGTRILTHFIPSRDYESSSVEGSERTSHFTTYNGYLSPSQVKGGWERYSQKYLNDEVLMSFGYGDGGGGPTRDMLENQRRLAKGIPGCPQTVMSTAADFFHVLEAHVRDQKYLPVWVGELYLEYHRGTYTSMARNKRYNRKAEFLLENVELYSELAYAAGHRQDGAEEKSGRSEGCGRTDDRKMGERLNVQEGCVRRTADAADGYPKEELDVLWETVLRNQFHDILPGSSIREVYEDSKAEYEQVLAAGNALKQRALREIAEQIDAPKDSLIVFNPNSTDGSGPVVIPCKEAYEHPMVTDGERTYPVQRMADGSGLFYAEHVPSKGYRTYRLTERIGGVYEAEHQAEHIGGVAGRGDAGQGALQDAACAPRLTASVHHLENRYVRVEFAPNGQFSSIYDKTAGRELLKAGQYGNVLMTYEDRPHNYDAWDVNNYYTEKSWEISELEELSLVESGAVRATVKLVRRYLDSVIVQYISLDDDSPEIRIQNEIDWREHKIFMKSLFPVDIHTDEATFEIQYGNVKRKTHYNTSWDFARFEVCSHKWLDVSEDGYGVSVLNDCKYGVNVHDGVIGLSMLKSATHPNPAADKEHHSFTFVIYLHQGDFREARTVDRAYALNNPLTCVRKEQEGGRLPAAWSAVSVDAPNVIVEVVKRAEDGDGTIVRMYEAFNRRTEATVTLGLPAARVFDCNLLEEPERELAVENGTVKLTVKPYEIRTLKLLER